MSSEAHFSAGENHNQARVPKNPGNRCGQQAWQRLRAQVRSCYVSRWSRGERKIAWVKTGPVGPGRKG